jgi:hypothetical protein
MEPEKSALLGDLVHAAAPPTPKSETDVDIAPLVQKVGTTAIVEIEKLIGEMQEARDFLQSEGERIQREAADYTYLTQMASASIKIIFDTVAGWREAGHPLRNQSRSSEFEVTPSLETTPVRCACRISEHHSHRAKSEPGCEGRKPSNSIGGGLSLGGIGRPL